MGFRYVNFVIQDIIDKFKNLKNEALGFRDSMTCWCLKGCCG